jgi:hypothetical protein
VARRHEDLTPDLDIRCAEINGGKAILEVELTGPAGLDRLDEVRVRIRNDRRDRTIPNSNGLSAEQLADAIFGPYRLQLAPAIDRVGREMAFSLPKQEPRRLFLEESMVPSWYTVPELWRRQFEGTPIRLELTCRRDGYEPWVVLREITPVDPAKQIW